MRVTFLLADAAQACDGKLFVMGGGWTKRNINPAPMAIVLKIDVPWTGTNEEYKWELKLLDQDENAITVTAPEGDRPLSLRGGFEVGRPAGHEKGSPVSILIALNLGPMFLPPGSYVWRLFVNNKTEQLWSYSFSIVNKRK